MALKIRLARGGSKKAPYYRVVVTDGRSARDGKFIEKVGTYDPLLAKDDANRMSLNMERIQHWLSNGAQPTDRVAKYLAKSNVVTLKARSNPKKGTPKAKAQERIKAAEAAAAKAAEAAASA